MKWSSEVNRNFKKTGDMGRKLIGALVQSTGDCGTITAMLSYCKQGILAFINLVTYHPKRCSQEHGLCLPMESGAHPRNKYTAWVQMPQCCPHLHQLQPSQQHVGGWVLCPSSSAPLSLPISTARKEVSGTYPQMCKKTTLPLQADFRSHLYSGGKKLDPEPRICLSVCFERRDSRLDVSTVCFSQKSPLRVISLANKNRNTTVINRNHSLEKDPKSEPCW